MQISLGTKFPLKLTILILLTKFAQKRLFRVENKESEHHYRILHTWISLGTDFILN